MIFDWDGSVTWINMYQVVITEIHLHGVAFSARTPPLITSTNVTWSLELGVNDFGRTPHQGRIAGYTVRVQNWNPAIHYESFTNSPAPFPHIIWGNEVCCIPHDVCNINIITSTCFQVHVQLSDIQICRMKGSRSYSGNCFAPCQSKKVTLAAKL